MKQFKIKIRNIYFRKINLLNKCLCLYFKIISDVSDKFKIDINKLVDECIILCNSDMNEIYLYQILCDFLTKIYINRVNNDMDINILHNIFKIVNYSSKTNKYESIYKHEEEFRIRVSNKLLELSFYNYFDTTKYKHLILSSVYL